MVKLRKQTTNIFIAAGIFFAEFLLGEKILAAPVIEQGATERNIYLPAGRWTDGNTKEVYEGKQWIMKYQAPIGILPYFIREDES